MLQHLARTVRTLSGHVGASSLPAQQRIARWLLGQPTGEDSTIRTTHEEIGQAVGLSRVTVSRVLGEFTSQSMVSLGYRTVAIMRRDRLEELAFET